MDTEKLTVLYLDADQSMRQAFEADFGRYYAVVTAASAEEALAAFDKHSIAVAIVDQQSPEISGTRFLEALLGEHPTAIRMLVSDSKDSSTLIDAINSGQIFRYISKPWDQQEFKQSIDMGLRIHQLEKKNRNSINQMQEESLKMQRLLNTFRKYVPGMVFDKNTSQETLFGGELRQITVLFVNISGLTELLGKTPAPMVLQYLNRCFSFISESIQEHRGTIDKFIGGSMLALFGAPVSYLDSEKYAVFASYSILEKLKKFNEEIGASIGFETQLNIGINSGEAIVGNIGSQQYISYTAIGDTVNIASRIADYAKNFPDSILISASVFEAVKEEFSITGLGEVRIKGKDKSINIYQINAKKIEARLLEGKNNG